MLMVMICGVLAASVCSDKVLGGIDEMMISDKGPGGKSYVSTKSGKARVRLGVARPFSK